MTITKDFGVTRDGRAARLFELSNEAGVRVSVSDFGATLVSVEVPGSDGVSRDVVLGYDDVAGYEGNGTFFGAIVGRVANRTAGAAFDLDGVHYEMDKNDGDNNLHSGTNFYSQRFWDVVKVTDDAVTFLLQSPDGDQGFPGTLALKVTYVLSGDNELGITYEASADADTLVNFTNHSYFNLGGEGSGDVLDHVVTIDAGTFTEVDKSAIPTGRQLPVEGTPWDFRSPKALGEEIGAPAEMLEWAGGYDHNYGLDGEGYRKVAEATSPKSGITMEVLTDRPGLQLYTANFLNNDAGKSGHVYNARAAVCFETQLYPDAVHHEEFASPVLKKGQQFVSTTTYRFSAK